MLPWIIFYAIILIVFCPLFEWIDVIVTLFNYLPGEVQAYLILVILTLVLFFCFVFYNTRE